MLVNRAAPSGWMERLVRLFDAGKLPVVGRKLSSRATSGILLGYRGREVALES